MLKQNDGNKAEKLQMMLTQKQLTWSHRMQLELYSYQPK